MRAYRRVVAAAVFAAATVVGVSASAQTLPMEAIKDSGQAVYPVYEGWYRNPDGSFTLLFGYFNRNSKQALDVALGPNNKVEPFGPDAGQPTHFDPKRGWGVFTVKVPKDFGTKKVVWTLMANGFTNTVPGHLDPNWFIEPFEDAANQNRPPTLRFADGGTSFEGPPQNGVGADLTAAVGQPMTFTVWTTDKKPELQVREGGARQGQRRERLDLSVFKFRGPGDVTFEKHPVEVSSAEGKANITATFSKAGEYILRVQGNDETGDGGSGFQCCWTSAYVSIVVK